MNNIAKATCSLTVSMDRNEKLSIALLPFDFIEHFARDKTYARNSVIAVGVFVSSFSSNVLKLWRWLCCPAHTLTLTRIHGPVRTHKNTSLPDCKNYLRSGGFVQTLLQLKLNGILYLAYSNRIHPTYIIVKVRLALGQFFAVLNDKRTAVVHCFHYYIICYIIVSISTTELEPSLEIRALFQCTYSWYTRCIRNT